MRLLAISDLHISHPMNRAALETLAPCPDDWLILAGDIADTPEQLAWALDLLSSKFRQLIWTPGNHELWTLPNRGTGLRGVALYDSLVSMARERGVITPEDPYPVFDHPDGPLVIAPLFLLYDYSFRPDDVAQADVCAWAEEAACLCSDEFLLHPDPYPDRGAWCHQRCAVTEPRLAALADGPPVVLVNHFPLEESLAVLPKAPRFTPWCGTRRTHNWYRRFNVSAVVFGHLHIRGTRWLDGVPFQEVSLGYPRQWDPTQDLSFYVHQVELAVRGARR